MDGTSHTVQIDNASNAKEVTDQVYSFIGLKDRFGFALYIAMKDKVKYFIQPPLLAINMMQS